MPTIIVCDDSNFMRNRVKSILTPLQAEILEVGNGKECLELLRTTKADVLLLDLLMPEMTGNQVLAAMKEQGLSVPAIVISADVQNATKAECMDLGAAAFFNKPPNAEQLLAFVSGILQKK